MAKSRWRSSQQIAIDAIAVATPGGHPRRRRGVQITPVGRRSLHSPIRCLDRIPTGTLSKKAASCPPPSISETCGVGRRLVMSRYTKPRLSARHQLQGRPVSRFNHSLIAGAARRRGGSNSTHLLRCMSPEVAHHVDPWIGRQVRSGRVTGPSCELGG
jgi:hypothetical protein